MNLDVPGKYSFERKRWVNDDDDDGDCYHYNYYQLFLRVLHLASLPLMTRLLLSSRFYKLFASGFSLLTKLLHKITSRLITMFSSIQLHSNFFSFHAVALQLSKRVVTFFHATTGISESQLSHGKVGRLEDRCPHETRYGLSCS